LLDIAVIGGGPIGSRTACQLAGMGYDVGVFEKRSGVGRKPCCTGIVSRECVRVFDIPQSVIYNPLNSASIFSPSGMDIHVSKPEPQAFILNRPAFDLNLADQAQAKGARYYLNSKIEEVNALPDKIVLKVSRGSESLQIESGIAVFACGFSSSLIKRSGLGCIDYFVAGAQAEVEVNGLREVEVYFDQSLAPGYFAWLVPLSENKGLAGLLTRQSPGKRLRDWISQLELQGRIKAFAPEIRYGGIPLKPLSRTFSDRLLVIGDAAGQVKPTTGGGIYFGLLCADIAAETIHKSFQNGDCSAHGLSDYERKWRKKLGHELRVEYLARRFYEKLNNKQIDSLFSRLNTGGLADSLLKEEDISFDWHGDLLLMGLKLGITSEINRLIKFSFNLGGK
jgi:digeranylgeranylglycerophospholipid reductase